MPQEGVRSPRDARPFVVLGLALVSAGIAVCIASVVMLGALPKLAESSTALQGETGTALPSVLPESIEQRIAELQGHLLMVQAFGVILIVAGVAITAVLGRAAFG